MNPAELWEASDEAFAAARELRRCGNAEFADLMASISDDFADQACDAERALGIVRELRVVQ